MIGCSVDWSQPDAFEQWQAKCAATKARYVASGTNAMDEALAAIAAATETAVVDSHEQRDARRIAAEAERINRKPVILLEIPALTASSRPKTIIAVCEAYLEQNDQRVSRLRLSGAIAYARDAIQTSEECANLSSAPFTDRFAPSELGSEPPEEAEAA